MSDRPDGRDEPTDEDADTAGEQTGERPEEHAGERPEHHAGDVPLSGLRADIEERRRERQESVPEPDEAFDEAVTEPLLDGEQVWEDLVSSQEDDAGTVAFGDQVEEPEDPLTEEPEADVTIIQDSVCHNCKYFGEPPELHCTHDGTSIRRMVDMKRFEVVDCPVVKSRSDLREQ